MPCANTLGETQIPSPPQAEPPPAPAPADFVRVQAALIRLVALAIALAVLELFGFRIRRERRRPNTPTPLKETPFAPAAAEAPAPPAPRERPVWRYLDRGPFLAALKSIADDVGHHGQAGDVGAAPPEPAAEPASRPIAPPRQTPRPPAPHSAAVINLRRAAPRPIPRLRSKTRIFATASARPIRSGYVMYSPQAG